MKIPKGMAVLLAEPHNELTWKCWCPFCRTWHYHSQAEGSRAPHCGDPATRTAAYGGHDYFIKRHPTAFKKVKVSA